MNQFERDILSLVVGSRSMGEPSQNGFARCGRRVPEVRALLKTPQLKELRDAPRQEVIQLWHDLYLSTPSYEAGSLAIYYYQYQTLTRLEFNKIKQWVSRCDCWEHSDDLSKMFADTLEQQPDWVLPVLTRWNQSKNPWHRRQSVVALLEYAQKRQAVLPYETLMGFVEPLLDDREYYVQKGVGWTLREIFNVYPKEVRKFFQQNVTLISPTAWSAATEKIDKPLKQKLNQARKAARAK